MRLSTEKPAPTPAAQVPLDNRAGEDKLVTETPSGDEKFKLDGEGGSLSDEDAPPAVVIPLKYRITAIVLIILFGTGNTYFGFILGPLKTRLVRELKITSKQRACRC